MLIMDILMFRFRIIAPQKVLIAFFFSAPRQETISWKMSRLPSKCSSSGAANKKKKKNKIHALNVEVLHFFTVLNN